MSLFKRFQLAGYTVQMLKTQYRMRPKIRVFPLRESDSEVLEGGKEVLRQTSAHGMNIVAMDHLSFFDAWRESSEGKSWQHYGKDVGAIGMHGKLWQVDAF